MARHTARHVPAQVAAVLDREITARRLTNREVGEAIGTTEHQVWRWRRGKINPSKRNLVALAHVLTDGDLAAFYEEP